MVWTLSEAQTNLGQGKKSFHSIIFIDCSNKLFDVLCRRGKTALLMDEIFIPLWRKLFWHFQQIAKRPGIEGVKVAKVVFRQVFTLSLTWHENLVTLYIHYIYIYNVMCDALLNPFKGGLYGKWRDLQAVWCERISNYPVLQVQYCTIGTLYFWHKTFKILLSFKMFSTFLWQCPRPTLISTAVPLYFFTKKIVLWARNVFISTHLEFV